MHKLSYKTGSFCVMLPYKQKSAIGVRMEESACIYCGKEPGEKSKSLGIFACEECQRERFSTLADANGAHMAVFMCCGIFDIACEPLLLDGAEDAEDLWSVYVDRFYEAHAEDDEIPGFDGGVTNIRMIFGKELSEKDVSRYIGAEKARLASLPGTAKQRDEWGTADKYTEEDYNELDRKYAARISGYRGSVVTEQMDYTLHEVAKWQLVADKMRRANNINAASNALKTVDTLLASECLRKKDEKPAEDMRVDALVTALEENGFMENKKLLTHDELREQMAKVHLGSRKYDYTRDVVDHVIEDIYNNMRENADKERVVALPAGLKTEDPLGECAPEPSDEEKRRLKFAQLPPVQFERG